MTIAIDELRALALRHASRRKTVTAIPRVSIMKGSETTGLLPGLYEPMLCLVLQGAKCVLIGDRVLHYDQASYFIASVEVPATGQIVEASPDRPYLAISLTLDVATIAEVMLDMAPCDDPGATPGFGISAITPELEDGWLRLIRLLERPQDIRVLAPLLEREILYRLLQGPQGGMLRQMARPDSRIGQIRRALDFIRAHFADPVRVDTLAEVAGMSVSIFHKHFRQVTAMSPIQYQKKLRLHEARRRLFAEPGDTAGVAFSVGYESATQFSREYSRMFGLSPARDAGRLRASGSDTAGLAASLA